MPHYKLTYFAGRGKAEGIRQTLVLAGIDFEDVRVTHGTPDWPNLKPNTPFGQIPVLEVDGKMLSQANAINKYIAGLHGLNGSNAWEAAELDGIGIHYDDLFNSCRPFYMTMLKLLPGDLNEAYKNSVTKGRDAFFPAVIKMLKQYGTGFIVGSKVSWVDLLVADHCETFLRYDPNYLHDYPEAKAHMERIHQIPAIKKWIETRPDTPI